ncbi:unnamed protein product [Prorocentrum cordatum]|uniref:Uncharacterized protein n=1 Tax=Prorocentrum cordatum TaxID=2364126 RepID=A0ABN9PJK5_9DINO|nr:unnamed protein product [Polarella glacialis]
MSNAHGCMDEGAEIGSLPESYSSRSGRAAGCPGSPEDLRAAASEESAPEDPHAGDAAEGQLEATELVLDPSARPRRSMRLAGGLVVKQADPEEAHGPPAHEPPAAAAAGARPRQPRSLRPAGDAPGRQGEPAEAGETAAAVREHLLHGAPPQRARRCSITELLAAAPLTQRSSRRSAAEPLAEGPLTQRACRRSVTERVAEAPLSQRSDQRSATEPVADGSRWRSGPRSSALAFAGGVVLQTAGPGRPTLPAVHPPKTPRLGALDRLPSVLAAV